MYAFAPQFKRRSGARAPQRKELGSLISDLLGGALVAAGALGTVALATQVGEWTAQALDSVMSWFGDEREAIYRRQDAINARMAELDQIDPEGLDASFDAEAIALEAEMNELWARLDKITQAEMEAEEERRNTDQSGGGWF